MKWSIALNEDPHTCTSHAQLVLKISNNCTVKLTTYITIIHYANWSFSGNWTCKQFKNYGAVDWFMQVFGLS